MATKAQLHRLAPGLALASGGAAVGFVVHALAPGIPAVLVALVLGVVLANARLVPIVAAPGLAVAAGPVLKAGIVLLGFELVLQDIVSLGVRGIGVVVGVVLVTFGGTLWAGRRLGVSNGLTLMIATGFSICGVSAIAAARDAAGADEEEVAYGIALVTLCGSLAVLLLPALRIPLGLDPRDYGAWVGASVHDVAQVVATSSAVGGVAVTTAIVVKLTRVLLLGPLVVAIGLARGRAAGGSQVRFVPLFIVLFLLAAAVRSSGVLPAAVLEDIASAKSILLTVALFAVGARVHVRRLVSVGLRPFLLALGSWAVVAGVAYAGIRLAWG